VEIVSKKETGRWESKGEPLHLTRFSHLQLGLPNGNGSNYRERKVELGDISSVRIVNDVS
jgi:hypothetical protein